MSIKVGFLVLTAMLIDLYFLPARKKYFAILYVRVYSWNRSLKVLRFSQITQLEFFEYQTVICLIRYISWIVLVNIFI